MSHLFLAVALLAELSPGAESAHVADLSRPATLREGRIYADDYPVAALRADIQGMTVASVSVGKDGRVLDCRIYRSSGFAILDMQSCSLIRERYLFDPARDEHGQPITVDVLQPIDWRLADDEPAPTAVPERAPSRF